MYRTMLNRLAAALLLLALAACGGDVGNGPSDDDIFGNYALRRANGAAVPGATVLDASPGPGASVHIYSESGSFRLSEDGTFAFTMQFGQVATDDEGHVSRTLSAVEDNGTYTLQNGTITLDGGTVLTLVDGVLRRTIVYDDIPGAPVTSVLYEFEK